MDFPFKLSGFLILSRAIWTLFQSLSILIQKGIKRTKHSRSNFRGEGRFCCAPSSATTEVILAKYLSIIFFSRGKTDSLSGIHRLHLSPDKLGMTSSKVYSIRGVCRLRIYSRDQRGNATTPSRISNCPGHGQGKDWQLLPEFTPLLTTPSWLDYRSPGWLSLRALFQIITLIHALYFDSTNCVCLLLLVILSWILDFFLFQWRRYMTTFILSCSKSGSCLRFSPSFWWSVI